jgi:hypothetical protein
MTRKEAFDIRQNMIQEVMDENPGMTREEARADVNMRINKTPRLLDVEKYQKGYQEPKQSQDELKWKGIKVHSGPNTAKDLGDLGKKFEEAAKIAFGRKKTGEQTAGELLKDTEKGSKFDPLSSEFDDDAWFGEEPEEETREEKLQRQIKELNEMRSHVSDLDEDYLLYEDAPEREWEGRMYDERGLVGEQEKLTEIVEALQRKAMQQGNVGATVNMPFDPNSVPSNQGFPMTPAGQNPIIQALQNQNRMGRPGLDVNSLRPGMNAPIMQSGRRGQFPGIGGSQGSFGPRDWNPYGGNPYGG